MALVISLLPFNIPLPGPLSGVGLETVLARTVDPSVAFEQGQAQPTTVDAVQYRVGSFTKATGNAPASQAITHNLGATPKALILWTAGQTVQTVAPSFRYGMGFSDGVTSYAFAAASQSGVNPSNSSQRFANKALTLVQWGEVLVAEADLVSWDATTFTLNWTTNNNSATLIHYMLIGGAGVAAKVVNWQAPGTTGPKAVTGVGFQPDLVLNMSGSNSLLNAAPALKQGAELALGAMNKAGEQWVTASFINDADNSSPVAVRSQRTDAAFAVASVFPDGIFAHLASFSSMDADGFTLDFSQASNATQAVSLALRGVDSKLGSFNTVSGPSAIQSITGVGFQPAAVMLGTWGSPASASVLDYARFALGASDGVEQGAIGIWQTSSASTLNYGAQSTGRVVNKPGSAGVILSAATLSSLDSDGFTLNWSVLDPAESDQFFYLALAAPSVPPVSGRVWTDGDRDGVQDAGEQGLGSVQMHLYEGICANRAGQVPRITTTNTDGNYTFAITIAGKYCVQVDESTLPADYGTTANQNPLDLVSGNNISSALANFGYASLYAADRLTVGSFSPCIDNTWLQSIAATHSATLLTADTEACVFTLGVAPAKLNALRAQVVSDPNVRHDHPDVRGYALYTPGDPDYNNPSLVYGPQQINAPTAWDTTRGDASLILAVIDTGIDFTHPEFAGRLLPGYDFANKDADPTDDNGHGTHVAGIAAAGIDNALGMAGMAGQVKILPVKVLNASNVGWMSDVAAGITYAVDQGAKVINLSLAATKESLPVQDAIIYAVSKGVVVIAAGGNDNTDVARYPAVYDNVIALGATAFDGSRWAMSDFGQNIDLMAPGSTVWSTRPGNTYAFMSGTSMAAPHAAGVAALMLSVNPNLTPAQIKQALQETAVDMGAPGVDTTYGYGLLNAGEAVASIPAGSAQPPVTGKTAALVTDVSGNGVVDPGDTLRYTISVGNADAAPLTGVIVVDTLPANTTYVAGSTTLNGIAVKDAGVTLLPLDEGGLAIGTVGAGSTSRVIFDVIVGQPSPAFYSLGNSATIQSSAPTQTVTATTPVGGSACTLDLTSAAGILVPAYQANDSLFVQVADPDQNSQTGSVQTLSVVLRNLTQGDSETLTLTETGPDTGIFRGSMASSTSSGLTAGDGVLAGRVNDTLQATYTDPDFSPDTCNDTATVILPYVSIPLYLSEPGQGLDRMDPVATGDTTTATSAVLSATATTFTQALPLATNFAMPVGGQMAMTTYVSTSNSLLPANPAITATLNQAGTTFATLTTPTVTLISGGPTQADVAYKVGNFTKRTSTGSQVITHNLGKTPKAIILWTSGQTSDGTVGSAYHYAQGISDGTTSYAFSAASQDNVGEGNTSRRFAAKAITLVEWGEVLLAEADLSSWNASSFTLNWTTNNSDATLIHYLLIGGNDVAAKTVNWQVPTSTGNRTITGVGFQPDLVIHLNGGTGLTGSAPSSQIQSATGFGVMNAKGEQWALAALAKDEIDPSASSRGQRTDAALVSTGLDGSQDPEFSAVASYVGMNADGFTLNFSTVSANHTAGQVASLALRGVDSKLGSFDKSTATGSQAVTGVGFQPEAIMLASWARTARTDARDDAVATLGASDGTTEGVSWFGDWDNIDPTNTMGLDKTSKVFAKSSSSQSIDAEADLTSLNADGFTLDWTTNADGMAAQLLYLALDVPQTIPATSIYRLDWSGALAGAVLAPAGAQLGLHLTSGEPGVTARVLYDSQTYPSRIELPTSTYITINNIGVYDGSYPAGGLLTSLYSGQTGYVRVTVGDPFGPTDITSLDLSLTRPAGCGSAVNVTLGEGAVVATTAATKTYQYAWDSSGCAQGAHTLSFVAHEGTEGVSISASTTFTVQPVGTIGDTVWADYDGDGIKDGPEAGIPGAVVELTNSVGQIRTTPTNSAGAYSFANVPAGVYTITLNSASIAADYNLVTTPYPQVVTLAPGESFTAADVGLKALATVIGDTIWYDADQDGLQDVGEPGIGNITLNLYLDNDNNGSFNPSLDFLVDSAVTDVNGAYRLDVPVAGDYFVDVTDNYGLLTGLAHTIGGHSISDPSPLITVVTGQIYRDADFGYVRLPAAGKAMIGDTVWVDGNTNGKRDEGEASLIGLQICATPVGGGSAICANTDMDGRYLLEVPTGSYTVTPAINPPGLILASPVAQISVANGEQRLDQDFGYTTSPVNFSTLGGLIWQDLPVADVVDGLYDAATEPGIGNVSVNVVWDQNSDNVWTDGEPIIATLSNTDGGYLFTKLLAGSYLVEVSDTYLALRNFVPTVIAANATGAGTNHAQPYNVLLDPGVNATGIDFGYREYEAFGTGDQPEPGMIGNQIWLDNDVDGLYNPAVGDQPLPGVTLEVRSGGVVMGSTTTGLDGKYLLMNLPLGRSYEVVVTDLFGVLEKYLPTTLGSPSQDNQSKALPYATFLALASTDFKADFGYARLSTVGDRVWWDVNQDGVQDAGEPGIPGVPLDLLDASGGVIRSLPTNGLGNYAFGDLSKGAYTVAVNLTAFQPGGPLAGWTASPKDITTEALDSDGDPTTHRAAAAPTMGAQINSLDFGYSVASGVQMAVSKPSFVRFGDTFEISITVTNTGGTWISQLPVCLDYDPTYMTLHSASPAPDSLDDTGALIWTDGLAGVGGGGLAPVAAGELAPGESTQIVVTFGGTGDSTLLPGETTPFTVTLMGGSGDPDGSGGVIAPLPVIEQSAQNSGVIIVNPTGVQLVDSGVQPATDGVRLSWRTVDESRVAGFHVWRQVGEGPAERITTEPVATQFGGQPTGGVYAFTDRTLASGPVMYEVEMLLSDGPSLHLFLGRVGDGFRVFLPLATR